MGFKGYETGHVGTKDRLQEAKVHKQLSHSNIAAMLDILEETDSLVWLANVEGETLDQWLRSHRPSREEAFQIFKDY